MVNIVNESEIKDILPSYDQTIQYPDYDRGLIMRSDIEVMLRLLKSTNSKSLLEIGTWLGKTTKILSLYLDKVYTLDIDRESTDLSKITKGQIGELLYHKDIGSSCFDRKNVIQFYGDSASEKVIKMVKNGIGKHVDSCFIDGNHTYEYCLSDTNNMLSMVKHSGLMMWHDVKEEDGNGVIDVLNSFPFTVYSIKDTWIGFTINV